MCSIQVWIIQSLKTWCCKRFHWFVGLMVVVVQRPFLHDMKSYFYQFRIVSLRTKAQVLEAFHLRNPRWRQQCFHRLKSPFWSMERLCQYFCDQAASWCIHPSGLSSLLSSWPFLLPYQLVLESKLPQNNCGHGHLDDCTFQIFYDSPRQTTINYKKKFVFIFGFFYID